MKRNDSGSTEELNLRFVEQLRQVGRRREVHVTHFSSAQRLYSISTLVPCYFLETNVGKRPHGSVLPSPSLVVGFQ